MIIHRIRANNVLKYTHVELDDLPEAGMIAITGPNESGKSTIGETLCFALFGRTFSLGSEDLQKVIHWGQTHCSVSVDFTASDGERYTLERFLDDMGNHSARIVLTGQDADAAPLARGVDKVADKVFELIGYEYEEFIESFYLAQREITTPHPHSYAIKTMAGLVTLEYCSNAFKEEQELASNAMQETRQELDRLARQVDEVELEPEMLQQLQDERAELATQLASHNRHLSALEQASLDYQDALPRRESALQGKGIAGFLVFLFLLLTLVTAGAWLLLAQLPEHAISSGLQDLLKGVFSNWNAELIPWLLYLAIAFVVMTGIAWARRLSLRAQLNRSAETGQTLAQVLEDLPSPEQVEGISEPASDAADEPPIEVHQQPERQRLIQRVASFQADFPEVREGVGKEQNLLRHLLQHAQEQVAQLDEAIAQQQTKLAKVEGLNAMQEDLEKKNQERQRHIELSKLAGQLIQGAMREISYQFNRKVRSLVGKTLPLFTDNRYEHLQIDEDLTVRAFSSEKRDFMDLEEISSGTQRQIMLAVRLAFSEELVVRTVKASQFLFLDEPFAFFDQARTRSSLNVLPKLSEHLNQIWIIGQEFPADVHFDRHIECAREYRSLPQNEV
jgi:exonuclease SbcC